MKRAMNKTILNSRMETEENNFLKQACIEYIVNT